MDSVIADMEADRLPLPAGTSAFEKEVLGASLLSEPFMARKMIDREQHQRRAHLCDA